MPALFSKMEAQRKVQLVKIRTGLKVNEDKYSLLEAFIDVEEYYRAESIPAALQGIIEQSGAQAAAPTKDLRRLTAASAANVQKITAARDNFNALFSAWNSTPDSEVGEEALSDAKVVLEALRPNHQLDGRVVFDAIDEEIKQAEPGSAQLEKINAEFFGH